MTATGTGASVAPSQASASGRRPGRSRWVGLVPIAVALVVLLLAELAIHAGRSHLSEPRMWPSPELEKKYGQIGGLAAKHLRPDIVLVGDSMMDAGGDPEGLTQAAPGLGIYNASIAGETLPVIADWTSRIVMPRLHPKVVVIGFSSNELNPHSLDPLTGVAAYRGSRVVRAAEGIGSPVDRADAWLREHSLLYRYRDSLRHPFSDAGDPNVFDPKLTATGHDLIFANQRYLQGGPARAQSVVEGVIAALRGFTVGSENITILQDMMRSIRRQGARVVLVAMPVTADLVRFHPQGAADYQRAMDAFGRAAQASEAVFVQPGAWPVAAFADPVHLNATGAARLTAYLAPLIQQEAVKAGLTRP